MGALGAIWATINSPDNDPIVIALIIGWAALLFANFRVFLANKARLADKDKHIEDLIKERDKYQEFVLGKKGIARKSSKGSGRSR